MLLSNAFRPDPRVLKEARSLVHAGYNVTVLCWDRQGELPSQETIEGIVIRRLTPIHSVYVAGSRQILYLPRFWQQAITELANLKPDLVHCHDLDTAPIGYWYTRTHNIPWIFDAHECYPEQIGPQVNRFIYYGLLWLEKFISSRATHVITVGQFLAQRFERFGATVSVIGNYAVFPPPPSPISLTRSDIGLNPDDFVVAYVGGFTQARAILPLIQSTQYFAKVKILLLGDGIQKEIIVAQLSTYPQVRYLGHVPQTHVPAYTALADAIYYGLYANNGNSQYSTPNALFNAMVAGKPIITTDIGEIAHIVKQKNCGLVVEKATPVLLAEAIRTLSNPTIRQLLGENAYRLAQNKYNWQTAEQTLINLYHNLLEDSTNAHSLP